MIGIIIAHSITLYINIKFVKNFMEKINIYFNYYKNDYIYAISMLMLQILIFLGLTIITIFTYFFKKSDINNNENLSKNMNKIKMILLMNKKMIEVKKKDYAFIVILIKQKLYYINACIDAVVNNAILNLKILQMILKYVQSVKVI